MKAHKHESLWALFVGFPLHFGLHAVLKLEGKPTIVLNTDAVNDLKPKSLIEKLQRLVTFH